jgi:hypothetical protein
MMYVCMALNLAAGAAVLAGVIFVYAILGGQVDFALAALIATM